MRKKKNTREQDRGDHFLKILKMWKILHADGGRSVFNKTKLARIYFGLSEVRERHKRYVQRLMVPLVKGGIARDTDMEGKNPKRKRETEERWWKYISSDLNKLKAD